MAELRSEVEHAEGRSEEGGGGIDRRRFLTWVMAAPVLTVGVKTLSNGAAPAAAQVPKPPQIGDGPMDLGRQLQLANMPTEHNIKLEVGEDSIVRFEAHRMEVGQGITTASAIMIADEMGIPLEQVEVTLRDAAPELLYNQLTGGSATIRHFYRPVRQAAAAAREQLLGAAAQELGVSRSQVSMEDGEIQGPGGPWPIGAYTAAAANYHPPTNALIEPKSIEEQTLIGTPTRRIDALDIVTGRNQYTMDIDVPGAKPMMVRRAPQVGGTPTAVHNADAVREMSGVIDVVELPTGVGVIAETFGEAEVAKNALQVDWAPGPHAGQDDEDIWDDLRADQLPFAVTGLAALADEDDVIDAEFTWPLLSHAPLETNTAIADVREDSAEFWAGLKIPIIALQDMAQILGMDEGQVRVHVIQGGASMGRRLFHDAMTEAAIASQQAGIPVKNMWTRLDDIRHGRGRAPAVNAVRAVLGGDNVLSMEHRMSGLASSAEHGLGEALTAEGGRTNNLPFSQAIFHGVIETPYNFGVVNALLNEPFDTTLNTGSWRSPYSSQLRPCEEVIVDELAAKLGEDRYEFRRRFIIEDRLRAVLDAAAEEGDWGREMPEGHAQGIAVHAEYNSYSCYLVELDATDESNPRVTKAVCAVDVGNPINPSGIANTMLGCLADGIGAALRWGLHIRDGSVVESSFADFKITRQEHYPTDTKVIVMPPNTEDVGGAGELGVAGATAAVACAFAAATGRTVRSFPVNFDIDFEVVPDVPEHPTHDA